MRNTFTFSFIAVVLLSSFAGPAIRKSYSDLQDTPVAKLEGHQWYLSTIYTASGYIEIMERKAFILFNTVNGKVSGSGSCNAFGGKVTIEGDALSFSQIFSTKKYCTDVQSVENDFFRQLQKVTRYEIKGNRLLLYAGDDLLLEFVE